MTAISMQYLDQTVLPRKKKHPEPMLFKVNKPNPPAIQNKDYSSSSEDETANIPLIQRQKLTKKKTIVRLKESKADKEVLDEMENPKPSTSAPLRREMERKKKIEQTKMKLEIAENAKTNSNTKNNNNSNQKETTTVDKINVEKTLIQSNSKSPIQNKLKRFANGVVSQSPKLSVLTPVRREIKKKKKTEDTNINKVENKECSKSQATLKESVDTIIPAIVKQESVKPNLYQLKRLNNGELANGGKNGITKNGGENGITTNGSKKGEKDGEGNEITNINDTPTNTNETPPKEKKRKSNTVRQPVMADVLKKSSIITKQQDPPVPISPVEESLAVRKSNRHKKLRYGDDWIF